jgi:hypothetical protein
MYINTVDCVDIATGWTEQRAVWGKNCQDVIDQIQGSRPGPPAPPLSGFSVACGSHFGYPVTHVRRK